MEEPSSQIPLVNIPASRFGVPRIAEEEDKNDSVPFTPSRAQRAVKTYQIDQEAVARYKNTLQKRVAWSFVILFVVILERIFSGYTQEDENKLIIILQSALGISYQNTNWFLEPVVFLEKELFFMLLMTHYFVIIYYFYNSIVCLKIMFVHFNVLAVMSILEMLFSDSRPYWDNWQIAGATCEESFGFPSFPLFCILFLFMYSWHCFQEEEDDEDPWEKSDIIKCAIFVTLFGIFCFLKVVAGLVYISQVLLTILYAALCYYLAIFFDKSLTVLVENSSIDVQTAKRYSIFWMVFILMFSGIATIAYLTADVFLNITWFANFVECLVQHGETDVLTETPYYHLIGAWGSFQKTIVLFALLGTIFGAAKTFRDFKGVLWYLADKKAKAKMTAIASLCILPSWILIYFQTDFLTFLEESGIDAYLFNSLHFVTLYFVLFGVLPKHVFLKRGILSQNPADYAVADEMVQFEGNTA